MLLPALFILAATALTLWHLDTRPPPWWDEGWTLQAARNWVELGHYGRLLDGQPAPVTLVAKAPITLPVALSFLLLGVGFWQARLVTVLYLVAGSLLFYRLNLRLFGRGTALLALGLSLFAGPIPSASAIGLGRQVLGEWAMLAFLAAGLLVLTQALERRAWLLAPAALLLALAVVAKSQLEPFLLFASATAVTCAWMQGERSIAGRMLVALAATAIATRLLLAAHWLLPGYARDTFDLEALYRVTVFVLEPTNRIQALRLFLLAALPAAVALAYAAGRFAGPNPMPERYVRLLLWGLAASWLVWFVCLSAGWPRYLFPALYLATPFVVDLLRQWSQTREAWSWRSIVALSLGAQMFLVGGISLVRLVSAPQDSGVREAAAILNSETPRHARVETYESELMFLLDRPYHYPPVDTHIEMARRFATRDATTVSYDALASDPDYLVEGAFSRTARLYQPFVEAGHFRLWREAGLYRIYERVR